MTTTKPELPMIPLASPEAWLEEHHATSEGLWLKIARKDSGIETASLAEAIEVALCYKWSKRSRARAAKLIEEGRMKPAGLQEVERARADGRWEAA